MYPVKSSLVSRKINIDELLLDPNNPRFCAFRRKISVGRIVETGVQKKTLQEISEFGVDELKESILQVGFLPIDRIVVVLVQADTNKYVAIEGNRRLAAVKSILQDVEDGQEVDEGILSTLKEIDVLVLDGKTYENSISDQLLIQGLRHISGVRNWKPYQQAKALAALVNEGHNITDAAKAIGMGRSTASRMRKAFSAFEEMRKYEEIELPKDEDEATSYFSYFVELLKDASLREYFEWSDTENKFSNTTEILKFYRWIGVLDVQEDGLRQIPQALEVRQLSQVLNNQEAKRALEMGNKIDQAYALCTSQTIVEEDHTKTIGNVYTQLKKLPSTFVKRLTDHDRTTLHNIIEVVREHLG
jgi:hypothetical protein